MKTASRLTALYNAAAIAEHDMMRIDTECATFYPEKRLALDDIIIVSGPVFAAPLTSNGVERARVRYLESLNL